MPFELRPAMPDAPACLRFFGHLTVPELQRAFLARIGAGAWRHPILLDLLEVDDVDLPPASVTAVATFVVRWAARLRSMGRVAVLTKPGDVEAARQALAEFPGPLQAQMRVVTSRIDAAHWLGWQPPVDEI